MKLESKKIEVDGVSLSYFDEGTLTGPPIIFIHGFPFNKMSWEGQFDVVKDMLKDVYRVLAYDVQGHGVVHPGSRESSIQRFVKDLFLFMDALHIKKAFLCGLSMGRYIALKAVQQQPERITGLALCEEIKRKGMETIQALLQNCFPASEQNVDVYNSNS